MFMTRVISAEGDGESQPVIAMYTRCTGAQVHTCVGGSHRASFWLGEQLAGA